MPEISLPTKGTQDLIKTETDKIASKSSQLSVDAVKSDTDLIKAYVDELEGRMGINTNAAGTTTLFARLAQIAAYVDTLESDTSLIKGYTDTLESNVGSDANAASASGSVHAKIKELRNQVLAGGGTDWATKTFALSNSDSHSPTYTWFDITGSGYLVCLKTNSTNVNITIAVDGGAAKSIDIVYGGTPFLIRFNTRLIVKGQYASTKDVYGQVVLD
jgi:hypothetical protein